MEQYIPKSTLVAEIKKRIEHNTEWKDACKTLAVLAANQAIEEDKKILSIINTLEVKGADLEKDVRQILSLYYEGIKHYDDIIKEEREENGGSDLAIKIMDGVVDARELGIQYIIDKLKAQKGENNYHGLMVFKKRYIS